MGLDPQTNKFLEIVNSKTIDHDTLAPEEARQTTRTMMLKGKKLFGIKKAEDVTTTDARRVPLRWYTPETLSETLLPVLVYFHGGGWVTGDLDVFDPLCRALAHHSGIHVVSVGYKLAPKHKFPEGLKDAYSATVWVAQHAAEFGADPSRLAVGGDSAGGNFAAVVSVLARDQAGPKISLQVLLYPVVLMEDDNSGHSKSMQDFAAGYYLTIERMDWYFKQVLNNAEEGRDPMVSVSLTRNLTGLPAAYVVTAEFDVLRDQGKDYADKLQSAGVSVNYRCYPGQLHSFIGFATSQFGTDVSFHAIADVAKQLRTELGIKR